jgi:hypothetical protein
MTTVLAIAGLAVLFVVFGTFRPGAGTRCGDCSCSDGTCLLEPEDGAPKEGAT